MTARRTLVFLLASGTAIGLTALMAQTLAPGGWTPLKLLALLSFAGMTPWAGLGAANGLIGWIILCRARDPVRVAFGAELPAAPHAPIARTAIAVTTRNEPFDAVLPPLRTLLDGLDAAGHGASFALFILSDTDDAELSAAEEEAFARFRAADREPSRIHYRRRPVRHGFKAGNIMDFLDHEAAGFMWMLTLDADSAMSAAAVLRLAAVMQANPWLGIVQHLTVGLPAAAPFPRLVQFGMRAGMRSWATGQGWWQGDQGPYWGHNAMIRISPFRAHCRLDPLPGGRAILSHDQVEAARMRAAGWHVRVLPVEDGSREAFPPALPEYLSRDRRWLAGNMQYWRLLGGGGLTWLGRWQLVQAILLFAVAPFPVLLLACCAALALSGQGDAIPETAAAVVMLGWAAASYAPKLLGYAEMALSPRKRALYGGGVRLAAGMVAEIIFALLLDPVVMVGRTIGLAALASGARENWARRNRADRVVGWREATRLLWPQTMLGIAAFGCLALGSWTAALWALPLAGGLLAAIPLCVLSARPGLGAWMRRHAIAAMPEEIKPASVPAAGDPLAEIETLAAPLPASR